MGRRRQSVVLPDDLADRYAEWRARTVEVFTALAERPLSEARIEAHVGSMLAGRSAWAQDDDFSVVGPFAAPDVAMRRDHYRRPQGAWAR